jgi:hypothetical protein
VTNKRRRRRLAVAWAAQGVVWAALSVASVVVPIVVNPLTPGDVAAGIAMAVASGAAALALFRAARGWSRAGVLVSASGIVVANPLKNQVVRLDEAEGFEAGLQSATVGNPTPGIVLVLHSGKRVAVRALAKEGFVWSAKRDTARLAPTAEGLNDLLASAKQAATHAIAAAA